MMKDQIVFIFVEKVCGGGEVDMYSIQLPRGWGADFPWHLV